MSVSVNVACYFPFLPSDHNKTAGECPYWDPLKGCVPQRHKAREHSHRNRFWCSSHLDYWLWLCHPSVRPHGHNHAGWGIFLTVLFPFADSNLFLRPTQFKLCLCGSVNFFIGTLAYAPPEWFLNGSYKAAPTTVWQIGVVMYMILHSSLPFENKIEIIENEPNISDGLSLGESNTDTGESCTHRKHKHTQGLW